MNNISLKYGSQAIDFAFEESRFDVLGSAAAENPLSDAAIGAILDNPVDSAKLEEIVSPGETVLFVVPDATRQTGAGQIVNLLVRRLIANGTMPYDIRVIFATGIHRQVTEEEKREILTPFIFQRIKCIEHNAKDLADLVSIGKTARGIPIQVNRAVREHNHVVLVGGISFHYFAGFTGGRKLICPGLGSSRTISETHRLAFDFERKTRREGVGLGQLDGNAVHEEFIEVVRAVSPSFSVNAVTNGKGEIVDLNCGHWLTSHQKACQTYAAKHTISIDERRDLVIVSCGGSPYDINMIQAHKALEMASQACRDGGTIVFLAECRDGLGRSDFLNWFESGTSAGMAEKLCSGYQVNGQTAWSLMSKAERFTIKIITTLPENEIRRMGLHPAHDLESLSETFDAVSKGFILPFGSKYLISLL